MSGDGAAIENWHGSHNGVESNKPGEKRRVTDGGGRQLSKRALGDMDGVGGNKQPRRRHQNIEKIAKKWQQRLAAGEMARKPLA
jgi:hypothetical protein